MARCRGGDSVVTKLGEALHKLGLDHAPVHPTTYVEQFLDAVRARQPALLQPLVKLVARPQLLAQITRLLPNAAFARGFSALLSNTAAATVVRAGAKTNVIPGVAEFEIDGRTLPGQTDDDLLRELRAVLGDGVELEVMKSCPPVVTEPVASPVYDAITRAIGAREPDAVVIPCHDPGPHRREVLHADRRALVRLLTSQDRARRGDSLRRHVPRHRRARPGRRGWRKSRCSTRSCARSASVFDSDLRLHELRREVHVLHQAVGRGVERLALVGDDGLLDLDVELREARGLGGARALGGRGA